MASWNSQTSSDEIDRRVGRSVAEVRPERRGDVAILICIASATVLVHVLTGHQYGFHRDELATL